MVIKERGIGWISLCSIYLAVGALNILGNDSINATFAGGSGSVISINLPRSVRVRIDETVTTPSLGLVFLNAYSSMAPGGGATMDGLTMTGSSIPDTDVFSFNAGIPVGNHNYREFSLGFTLQGEKTLQVGETFVIHAGTGASTSAWSGYIPDAMGPFEPEIIDSFGNPIAATVTELPGTEVSPFEGDLDFTFLAEVPTSETSYSSAARAITATAGHVYVWNNSEGLKVFDVSNPSKPQIVGRYNSTQILAKMIAIDHLLILNHQFSGIKILDISDPANPFLVGSNTTVYPGDIVASGNHLFVSDGSYVGLRVIDFSSPGDPQVVGEVHSHTSATPGALTVAGDHVFMVDGNGFTVFDVTNPLSPKEVQYVSLGNHPWSIGSSSNSLILAGGSPPLAVFSIANPTAPAATGGLPDPLAPRVALNLVDTGSTVMLSGQAIADGLYAYDVRDSLNPVLSGRCQRVIRTFFNDWIPVKGIAQESGNVYLASDTHGLIVVQTASAVPPRVGTIPVDAPAWGIDAVASLAAVVGSAGKVTLIDTSDPAKPTVISSLSVPGSPNNASVNGSHVFIATQSAGLQIADFTDVANPQIAGGLQLSGEPTGVFHEGDLCYVACASRGLSIVDVSQAGNPQLLGAVDTPGIAKRVVVGSGLAMVADGTAGVSLVDVTQSSSPQIVGTYDTPGDVVDVANFQHFAVAVDAKYGAYILDINNPSSPQLAGRYDHLENPREVVVVDQVAYVADDTGGIEAIDLRNPHQPARIGGSSVLRAQGIAYDGTHLLAIGQESGMSIFNLAMPAPRFSGIVPSLSGGADLTVEGISDTILEISRSSNLIDWVPWKTVTLTNGMATLHEDGPSQAKNNFYRAIVR